jgi:hypothetical protein
MKEKIAAEVRKYLAVKIMRHDISNLQDAAKVTLRRKFIALCKYIAQED